MAAVPKGSFEALQGVAVGHQGQTFACDETGSTITAFSTRGEKLFSIGGRGFSEGQFQEPRRLAVNVWEDEGELFVVDKGNRRVQVFKTADGSFKRTFGSFGFNEGQFRCPFGVGVHPNGAVLVTDFVGHCVHVMDADGEFIERFGSKGSGEGNLDRPTDIGSTAMGEIFVLDSGNHRVCVFDDDGKYQRSFGCKGTGPGQFQTANSAELSMTIDTTNDIVYLSDCAAHKIHAFECNDTTYLGSFGCADVGSTFSPLLLAPMPTGLESALVVAHTRLSLVSIDLAKVTFIASKLSTVGSLSGHVDSRVPSTITNASAPVSASAPPSRDQQADATRGATTGTTHETGAARATEAPKSASAYTIGQKVMCYYKGRWLQSTVVEMGRKIVTVGLIEGTDIGETEVYLHASSNLMPYNQASKFKEVAHSVVKFSYLMKQTRLKRAVDKQKTMSHANLDIQSFGGRVDFHEDLQLSPRQERDPPLTKGLTDGNCAVSIVVRGTSTLPTTGSWGAVIDPYAFFVIPARNGFATACSHVEYKTARPTWDELLVVKGVQENLQEIRGEVWDSNMMKDVKIGEFTLKVTNGQGLQECPLTLTASDPADRGAPPVVWAKARVDPCKGTRTALDDEMDALMGP